MALKFPKGPPRIKPKLGKGSAFKSSRGAKFVLFVGDEGAILVYIHDNVVQSRQYIPDASEPHLLELQANLDKDTKAPIMLVVDSMDQSYVQQTLPPVSKLSLNKLIKRRMDRDFGPEDIRGALVISREQEGRKDWNFLMVSVDKSPHLTVWLNFLASLPNRFQGIYLISVESEILIRVLDRAMGVSKLGTVSKWAFFVSHNKVGGFRQVVLHNGRIIFTRLAQPIGESTPEVIAGNIEQEMLSTIEYMKRLSFNADEGLDVYIIASSGIKPLIDPAKLEAANCHILTPFEVSQYLNIEGATRETDQFGDVILAAFIGCSKKHILTLLTAEAKRINRLLQAITLQRTVAVLAGIGLLAYAGMLGYQMKTLYDKNVQQAEKKITEQKNLDALLTEIKQAHLDIMRLNEVGDLYRSLLQEQISPAALIAKLGTVINPPIFLKAIKWELVDDKKPAAASAAPALSGGHTKMVMTLTVAFPDNMGQADFAARSAKLLENAESSFTGYDVKMELPKTVNNDAGKVEMTFGDTAVDSAAKAPVKENSLEAQLIISGAVDSSPAASDHE